MQTAGYSGTPLAKKLGIKSGFKIALINAPQNYFELFTDMPPDITVGNDVPELKDLIHLFTKSRLDYMATLPRIKNQIVQNGMIWISWPKKSSKVATDMTETSFARLHCKMALLMLRFALWTKYGRH